MKVRTGEAGLGEEDCMGGLRKGRVRGKERRGTYGRYKRMKTDRSRVVREVWMNGN